MSHFLGNFIPKLIQPTVKKRGFVSPRVLMDWEKIVGQDLVLHCKPDRIVFPRGQKNKGTLYLVVDPKSAFRFDYIKDLILEKVNTYFGYGALSFIKIFQKPVTQSISKKPVQPALSPSFKTTGHPLLDQALKSYGQNFPEK